MYPVSSSQQLTDWKRDVVRYAREDYSCLNPPSSTFSPSINYSPTLFFCSAPSSSDPKDREANMLSALIVIVASAVVGFFIGLTYLASSFYRAHKYNNLICEAEGQINKQVVNPNPPPLNPQIYGPQTTYMPLLNVEQTNDYLDGLSLLREMRQDRIVTGASQGIMALGSGLLATTLIILYIYGLEVEVTLLTGLPSGGSGLVLLGALIYGFNRIGRPSQELRRSYSHLESINAPAMHHTHFHNHINQVYHA